MVAEARPGFAVIARLEEVTVIGFLGKLLACRAHAMAVDIH